MSIILVVITLKFVVLNVIEAGLWMLVGNAAVAVSLRRRGVVRRELLILAATLIVFGISDLIETRTGAWWRPWWLLAIKGACVLMFAVLLWRYLRRRIQN